MHVVEVTAGRHVNCSGAPATTGGQHLATNLLKHPDEIFATYVKQMKHFKHVFETCEYNHCDMCNTRWSI
jgi:hypothetical protein